MTEEIKEILDKLKNGFCSVLTYEKLLDYITNLQQDLEKANDIIEKDKYADEILKNAKLKEENKELNRMCELYSKSLYNAELTDYKSRFEKAIKDIDLLMTGNYEACGTIYLQSSCCNKRLEIIKKDLIGSDENETNS